MTCGPGRAEASRTLSLDSSALAINMEFHQIGGASGADSLGTVYFTIDEAVPYEISGLYSMEGPWAAETYLQFWLVDLTDGVTVFNNLQRSRSTLNESFVLGEEGGDWENTLEGALAGSLQPARHSTAPDCASYPASAARPEPFVRRRAGRASGAPRRHTAYLDSQDLRWVHLLVQELDDPPELPRDAISDKKQANPPGLEVGFRELPEVLVLSLSVSQDRQDLLLGFGFLRSAATLELLTHSRRGPELGSHLRHSRASAPRPRAGSGYRCCA